MPAKKIGQSDIIGDRGIALIHRIVSQMGFIWNPTGLEAGIDGYIEIRDPRTGEVTNLIIQVQSKATERDFQAETGEGFEYHCEARDLEYWLGGNAPVILVRSRPSKDEAYWVSLKDYFHDLATRGERRIHFDKSKDRFDFHSRDALVALARPKNSGLYLTPVPKIERIYSNLLEVTGIPEYLYIAETDFRQRGALWKEFKQMGVRVGGEWLLKNRRLMSIHDLEQYPWNKVCDQGTVECFDLAEWATSEIADTQHEFVQLMKLSLKERVWPTVRYDEADDYYFFAATNDLSARKLSYKSLAKGTSRTVFQAYPYKSDPSRTSYYRHSAFSGRFKRYDNVWYLEITPTYHYTVDGYRKSRYSAEYLKGIKRIERNPAVLGQVAMWADYLQYRPDLFTDANPRLVFGSLASFKIEAGLDDQGWLGNEEADDAEVVRSPINELPLFEQLPE